MLSNRHAFCVVLLLLCCQLTAAAGTYSDPSGFSFTYPEGWTPVNGETANAALNDQTNDAASSAIKNLITKHKIDLSKIKVYLFHLGDEEFSDNLNVSLQPREIPVNDKTAKQVASIAEQKLSQVGVKIASITSRVAKFGSRDVLVIDFQSQIPGVEYALRQRQVMFPGGGNTYTITCTTKADSYDRCSATFDKIIASFNAPPPTTSQGFGFGPGNGAMNGALIGAIAGGIVGIIVWLTKQNKRR